MHLEFSPLGTTNFQIKTTRIVTGFQNPIDAEIEGNLVYVIEYGVLWSCPDQMGQPGL